jgi:hypothetical protein
MPSSSNVPSSVNKATPNALPRNSEVTGPRGSGGGANSGNANPSPRTIYAAEAGVRTIGEYQQRLPFLIQENERLIKEAKALESSFKKAEVKHQAAAAELSTRAVKIFSAVKSLTSGEKSETEKALAISPLRTAAPAQKLGAQPVQSEEKLLPPEPSAEPELANLVRPKPLPALAPAEVPTVVSTNGEPYIPAANEAFSVENDEFLRESFREEIPTTFEQSQLKVASLKESLRKKLAAKENGGTQRENNPPSPTAPLVAEILREQRNISSINAASNLTRARQPAPSAEEAIADIESQVNELLQSEGILGSNTETLFRRVHSAHARSVKNGLLKQ